MYVIFECQVLGAGFLLNLVHEYINLDMFLDDWNRCDLCIDFD